MDGAQVPKGYAPSMVAQVTDDRSLLRNLQEKAHYLVITPRPIEFNNAYNPRRPIAVDIDIKFACRVRVPADRSGGCYYKEYAQYAKYSQGGVGKWSFFQERTCYTTGLGQRKVEPQTYNATALGQRKVEPPAWGSGETPEHPGYIPAFADRSEGRYYSLAPLRWNANPHQDVNREDHHVRR